MGLLAVLLVVQFLPTYVGEPEVPFVHGPVAPPPDVAVVRAEGITEFMKADKDSNGQVVEDEFVGWWTQFRKEHSGELIDFHAKSDPKGEQIPGDFRESVKQTEATTLGFWQAFINSLAMIIVTELGDKTFFIAAILSMRHPPLIIFSGAISALTLMTVIGVGVGFALPKLLPRQYTHYAATILFVYFGLRLLKEGLELVSKGEGKGPSDELDEVEQDLKDKHDGADSCETGSPTKRNSSTRSMFWQALTLTFIAEWGDRSQIATIALAAAKDPLGVTFGGVLGHSLCTGLACAGGKVVAGRISERNVLIVGGLLFLAFAIHSCLTGP